MATGDDDDDGDDEIDDDDTMTMMMMMITTISMNKCTIEHYQHLIVAVRNPPALVLKSYQSL